MGFEFELEKGLAGDVLVLAPLTMFLRGCHGLDAFFD